jgi:hypothetical protein
MPSGYQQAWRISLPVSSKQVTPQLAIRLALFLAARIGRGRRRHHRVHRARTAPADDFDTAAAVSGAGAGGAGGADDGGRLRGGVGGRRIQLGAEDVQDRDRHQPGRLARGPAGDAQLLAPRTALDGHPAGAQRPDHHGGSGIALHAPGHRLPRLHGCFQQRGGERQGGRVTHVQTHGPRGHASLDPKRQQQDGGGHRYVSPGDPTELESFFSRSSALTRAPPRTRHL